MFKNLMSASGVSLVRALVQFFLTIVLTRFIDPSTYGVMAFVLPIWTFITLMSEMGLGNSIVRAPSVTAAESGGALKISLVAALLGGALMVLAAYPAQWLLDDHRVPLTIATMAVVLILAMLVTVPRALLERELRYVLIARVEIIATFVAVPICIGIAALGGGIWSLLSYYLSIQIVRFICFYFLGHKNLELTGSWRAAKSLVAFGGWVLAFNVQNFLARNADNIIIGTYIGTTALGLYGLSYQIMTLPLLVITWPASSVLLATLSKYTNNSEEDSAHLYAKALFSITAAVAFPISAYLVCGITYPVQSFMGRLWHDVPDVLFWMAPVGALQSIAAYSGAILMSSGKVRLQFYFGIFSTITYIIVFMISVHWGIMPFVIFYMITSILLAIGHFHFIVKYCMKTWRAFARTLIPGLVTAVAGIVCYKAGALVDTGGNFSNWLVSTILFAAGCGLTLWAVRRDLFDEVILLSAKRKTA